MRRDIYEHPQLAAEQLAIERRLLAQKPNDNLAPIRQRMIDGLEKLIASDDLKAQVGHRYEVNIKADPESFLDYDRPIPQQGDAMKAKVAAAMDALERQGKPIAEYHEMIGTPHGSAALKQAGIPGIKYLDQGSRAAGEGSRNYVVFDDSLIDIKRKFAALLALMGGGAAAGMSQGQER